MLIQVEYDEKGEISSLSGPSLIILPHGGKAMMARIAGPGHEIAEIEIPEIRHDRDFENIERIKAKHRIIGHPHNPKLAEK